MTIKASFVPACAICLAAAFAVSLPQPARAQQVTPPRVPNEIRVPPGNEAFLKGHAFGTQNYICLPSDDGFAFKVTTHFFSPNPAENDKIRATWQHSTDSSIVWGGTAIPSTDPKFVAEDAIAWLLLPTAGVQVGPTGGGTLTAVTFIQRLNTSGGVAPPEECAGLNDLGKEKFVDYTADYFFYRKS
jgi:Protein of unknown function (DUF3455)